MTQVLVTGASGLLGAAIARALRAQGHAVVATWREHAGHVPRDAGIDGVRLDLEDDASIDAVFRRAWPEAVIHAAAWTDLRQCEGDPERARRVNVHATVKLARMTAALGSRFVFLSTDQVFDGARAAGVGVAPGTAAAPYVETDAPNPIHVYGRTKLEAEREVRKVLPAATVLRVCLVVGRSPSGDRSASEKVVNEIRAGRRPRLFVDEIRTPVAARDVARACVVALPERDLPLLHVAGPEALSRHELGVRVARAYGLDPAAIDGVRLDDVDIMPRRPRDLALDARRLESILRCRPAPIDEALREDVQTEQAERSQDALGHPRGRS